jgi:hypothetical protein
LTKPGSNGNPFPKLVQSVGNAMSLGAAIAVCLELGANQQIP